MLPGFIHALNRFQDDADEAAAEEDDPTEFIGQLKAILYGVMFIVVAIWAIHGYFLVIVFSYYRKWPNGKD